MGARCPDRTSVLALSPRLAQRSDVRRDVAGVVLNPATSSDSIAWVLDLVDIILVMTVNPGFGGQAFLPSQLPKIAALRRMIDASGRAIALSVDGGITPETAPLVIEAGADTLVAGTAVFHAADYAAAIAALRGAASGG